MLGAAIALSMFSVVNLSMNEIDSYRVEKWYEYYNVQLLSSNDTKLGCITLRIPDNNYEDYAISVSIGGDYGYAAIINEDVNGDWVTAEFRQHGETIGWIDITADHNGNIVLKNVSPSLKQFEDSFLLVNKISKDPAMIRALRNPIHIDGISGTEGYFCAAGAAGASYVFTPPVGFLYAVSCGLFADMDSWGGGVTTGGGGSSGDPCHGHECGYKVVRIWRQY